MLHHIWRFGRDSEICHGISCLWWYQAPQQGTGQVEILNYLIQMLQLRLKHFVISYDPEMLGFCARPVTKPNGMLPEASCHMDGGVPLHPLWAWLLHKATFQLKYSIFQSTNSPFWAKEYNKKMMSLKYSVKSSSLIWPFDRKENIVYLA